ncbi:arginase family protein [Salmonella enterica]|nr:arginase family protein [Salmonella enterica]
MCNKNESLRLIFPQWQGGNNPLYQLGSQLLAWLAPEAPGAVEVVPVPESPELEVENGIRGRTAINTQLQDAQRLIRKHQPESIVVLGGDCLVSLAPFAWLQEKYGDKLGVLWIDSHPDVQTPAQFANAHAHVLAALMGTGDADLLSVVKTPLSAEKIMIAGLHDPLPYEAEFIAEHGIRTCSPHEVRDGAEKIVNWLKEERIKYLAIHIDLDVLDSQFFRSVLFARPGRTPDEFGNVAEGKLKMTDVLNVVSKATAQAEPVGLTLAEHLPWDALNLKQMLNHLPLLGGLNQ